MATKSTSPETGTSAHPTTEGPLGIAVQPHDRADAPQPLRDVTADEVRDAVLASGSTFIPIRPCSICNVEIGYHVRDGEPWLDTNCDCVGYTTPLKASTWGNLAGIVNMQTTDQWKRVTAAIFHIDLDKPSPPATAPEMLYAVEEGTMEVMGHTLRTAVLNNGQRVVIAEDAEKFMRAIGMMP